MQIQTRGIVLKTVKYGEADLIITVLSMSGSVLKLFARSAFKSKKRFGGGVLEPTHYIEISYEDRRSRLGGESDLHSLKEAALIEGFSKLRSDYDRLNTALSMVDTVARLTRYGDFGSAEIFNLLGNSLKACGAAKNLELLRIHFVVRLLASQGVLELTSDVSQFVSQPIEQSDSFEISRESLGDLNKYLDSHLKQFLISGTVED